MKRALLSLTFINLWAWFLPVSIRKNSLNSPASHPYSTFAALKFIPLALDLLVAYLMSQTDHHKSATCCSLPPSLKGYLTSQFVHWTVSVNKEV